MQLLRLSYFMRQNRLEGLFAGRQLLIATKHKKDQVIAPVLIEALKVDCVVDDKIDTDIFGTFSGEVERINDALETCREKCRTAMRLSNCDMALASEGSFGAHPTLGFVNTDEELLVFMDTRNNLEIVVRELSTKTNFNGAEIKSENELLTFATDALFPSHGLIMRKTAGDIYHIAKGITDLNHLKDTFNYFSHHFGGAYVETDMRAMYNPTRMKVILNATYKLVEKIKSCCPACFTPGFWITHARAGLPCALCGFPTRSTLFYEYGCSSCSYTEEKKFPHGKNEEDPVFCDVCNP